VKRESRELRELSWESTKGIEIGARRTINLLFFLGRGKPG